MNYCVCIVEDDAVSAFLLGNLLEPYLEKKHINYKIVTYESGKAFYDDFKEGFIAPNIILMDIRLPEISGLDLCRAIRDDGYAGDILICTGSSEFIMDGYDVDARGYILKPYDPKRIYETLDRVLRYASVRTLTIQVRSQVIRIPVSEIRYVESNNNKCTIHCGDNVDYTIYKRLDAIEEELSDPHFLRCHKSYLVNMDFIVKAADDFELVNGVRVPIRKADIKAMKDKYLVFLGKHPRERG